MDCGIYTTHIARWVSLHTHLSAFIFNRPSCVSPLMFRYFVHSGFDDGVCIYVIFWNKNLVCAKWFSWSVCVKMKSYVHKLTYWQRYETKTILTGFATYILHIVSIASNCFEKIRIDLLLYTQTKHKHIHNLKK